jgi:hypothetical protein
MIPTRTTADLLAGTWDLLSEPLGAVPHRLIWDNKAGIGRRNHLAEGVAAFMGTLGSRIVQLRMRDPESKGVVERAIQYLEDSFLPALTFHRRRLVSARYEHASLTRACGVVVRRRHSTRRASSSVTGLRSRRIAPCSGAGAGLDSIGSVA